MSATFRLALGAAILATALSACKGSETATGDGGGPSGVCEITGKNKPETAQPLTLGVPYPGESDPNDTCIYPLKIQRWFSVEVTADQPLLTVDVAFPPQAKSKVNLVYQVLTDPPDTTKPVGGQVDQVETPHASHVVGTHYIATPGKYYILVHDAGDNAQDDVNTFTITASAAADPDTHEGQAGGNNDCAHAVPVGSGVDGYIAYQGDHDAFAITVPAGGQIIQLEVDYQGTILAGRLKVELFQLDGQTLLYEDTAQASGTPALITRRGVVGAGGDYCVVVRDTEDTAADPTTKYTVSATILAEPDQNEQTTRNDNPRVATDLSGGGSRTGFIASTGDADWYKVAQTPGQLMELRAQGSPSSGLALGMKIVYPHTTTPCACANGACDSCAYLTGNTDCTLPTDCPSNVCQRGKCALECDSNLDCPSLFCSAHACAGGGECLPEGQCAVTQFIKPPDTSSPNDVHTMQPAQAASTYVLVYDTHSPPIYDSSASYTFTFTKHAEPDTGEPDNFYNPYLTLESPETTPSEVIAKNWAYGRTASGNTATGNISYEGDIDLISFANPCGTGLCSIQVNVTGGGSIIDYVFFGYDNHHLNFSWRAQNNGFTFGDTGQECGFIEGNTLNILVRDWYHKRWDLSSAYTITVSGVAGCGFGCIPYPGGTCQPAGG